MCASRPGTVMLHLPNYFVTGLLWEDGEPEHIWTRLQTHTHKETTENRPESHVRPEAVMYYKICQKQMWRCLSCWVILPYRSGSTTHAHTKDKPPPSSSQWRFWCSFGGCTSPSSPVRRNHFWMNCLFLCFADSSQWIPLFHRAGPSAPNTGVGLRLISREVFRWGHYDRIVSHL